MTTRWTSLLPREHGAVAELVLPLGAALFAAPSLAGLLWGGAGAAVFLVHEPAIVLLGHRGARRREEQSAASARWVGVFSGLAVALFAGALLRGPREALLLGIVSSLLGLVAAAFALTRREKTLAGELAAAAALSSLCLPVLSAGGVSVLVAGWAWAVFTAMFTAGTICVRAIITAGKPHGAKSAPLRAALLGGVLLCLVGVCGLTVPLSRWVLAALIPPLLYLVGVSVLRPRVKHLRQLGWSFAAACMLASSILAASLSPQYVLVTDTSPRPVAFSSDVRIPVTDPGLASRQRLTLRARSPGRGDFSAAERACLRA